MRPTPAGWPRISSSIFYHDAAAALDWLCRPFGFGVRLRAEGADGRIEHSELEFGEGLIMVGDGSAASRRYPPMSRRSPRLLDGANTQALLVFVDRVGAHGARGGQ